VILPLDQAAFWRLRQHSSATQKTSKVMEQQPLALP